jgi:hypothetical protein
MAPSGVAGADDDAAATSYYIPMKATSEGVWQGDNPLRFSLPLVILQICLVVAVTRGLAFALRPLRQPRVIAEIIVSLFNPCRACIYTLLHYSPSLCFIVGPLFPPHFSALLFALFCYFFDCTI